LTGETRDKISALVPAVGSFARNPVDSWRAFYDPDYMGRILEMVFEEPDLDMIILDRLIPRMTYATPEVKGASQMAIDYLRKNRHRKPSSPSSTAPEKIPAWPEKRLSCASATAGPEFPRTLLSAGRPGPGQSSSLLRKKITVGRFMNRPYQPSHGI